MGALWPRLAAGRLRLLSRRHRAPPGNPVKEFEHLLGLWALRFLVATLAITPIRDIFGINWLRYRRALGLLAFYYVLMHFLAYMLLDQVLNVAAILTDIGRRPFITIGMAALVMLIPLALTSNNWSIRRLGTRWNTLHRLAYVIAAAGALHFSMSVKVVGPSRCSISAWSPCCSPGDRCASPICAANVRRPMRRSDGSP